MGSACSVSAPTARGDLIAEDLKRTNAALAKKAAWTILNVKAWKELRRNRSRTCSSRVVAGAGCIVA